MKGSLLVLVSMFLACSVFGQDAPQTKTEPALSFVSIHLAPGVSIRPTTAFGNGDDVAIRTGPAVGVSLVGRFPPAPWLIGSLALFGEYHPVTYKGSDGTYFAFAGYAQLGVLFDIAPAFSLGARFGPGYGYRSYQVSNPDSPGSGAGFSLLGGIFGWYRISPSWSLGAEIGSAQMPIEYGDRYFLAADVGYHFSALDRPAAQKAEPQPSTPQPSAPEPSTPQPSAPQPERQRQPSWLSLGAGAALDLTTWGDLKGNVSGFSAEVKEEMKPIDIKAFVDFTYLQVSAGYIMVNGATGTIGIGSALSTMDLKGILTYVSFAGYLKYPFHVGAVTVFPLLGVEYKLNLTSKDGSGNDVKSTMTSQQQADLNELWIEGGAGMDFTLGPFYIRPEVLIGFKPLSTTDNDTISAAESSGWTSVSFNYFTVNLNILVGYKL
jgi:hypothetical protein